MGAVGSTRDGEMRKIVIINAMELESTRVKSVKLMDKILKCGL